MRTRTLSLSSMVLTGIVLAPTLAWTLADRPGETNEQLRPEYPEYEVSVVDNHPGRVNITLTIADAGRFEPLTGVRLVIPASDETDFPDLVVPLATREVGGKRVVSIQLKREWAERAEFRLETRTLYGKTDPRTSYYHVIPIAEYRKDGEQKTK